MKQQDIDDLKLLMDILKSQHVAEFDFERGELKIRLKFQDEQPEAGRIGEIARTLGGVPSPGAAPAPAPAESAAALHQIKSPIVGTFYGSPAPGASPFVASGDRVHKGQVICIVEAMKLMNEIEADADGEVVRCLVANGQPIEYGQPLFDIRPA